MPDSNKIERLMKRCQVGCGGRSALNDARDIMAECYGTLGAMQHELTQLRVLAAEVTAIADESILPDGDAVDVSVALWADEWKQRLGGDA